MVGKLFRASRAAVILLLFTASPAFALVGNISAISYLDDSFQNRIQVFTISDSGHLVASKFDGTNWGWVDHGLPAGSTSLQTVNAVTYLDESGNRRIYVFAIDNNRRLKLRYLDGVIWRWVDQGSAQLSMSAQTAITYVDPAGNRRIYFFTDLGGLRYNYWNGSSWQWVTAGYPPDHPGGTLLDADAITYVDEQGNRRIDVFCIFYYDMQSDLEVYSWNGSSWGWTNLGGTHNRGVRALTYTEASGTRRIKAFAGNLEEELRVRSWNGDGPGVGGWANLTKPSSAAGDLLIDFAAVAYTDIDGNRRMQAFAQFDDRIWSRQWDGSSWQAWFSHGFPPGGEAARPTAITYLKFPGGERYIHLFVRCGDGAKLCDQVYNGTYWQWQDLGSP